MVSPAQRLAHARHGAPVRQFGGEKEGIPNLDLWYSKRSDKFDEGDQKEAWKGFKLDPPEPGDVQVSIRRSSPLPVEAAQQSPTPRKAVSILSASQTWCARSSIGFGPAGWLSAGGTTLVAGDPEPGQDPDRHRRRLPA